MIPLSRNHLTSLLRIGMTRVVAVTVVVLTLHRHLLSRNEHKSRITRRNNNNSYCANNPSIMNFILTSMIAISTIFLKSSWLILLTILLPIKDPASAIPNSIGI
jgi:hypothetical protein